MDLTTLKMRVRTLQPYLSCPVYWRDAVPAEAADAVYQADASDRGVGYFCGIKPHFHIGLTRPTDPEWISPNGSPEDMFMAVLAHELVHSTQVTIGRPSFFISLPQDELVRMEEAIAEVGSYYLLRLVKEPAAELALNRAGYMLARDGSSLGQKIEAADIAATLISGVIAGAKSPDASPNTADPTDHLHTWLNEHLN